MGFITLMEPVENWDLLPFSFPIQKNRKKKKIHNQVGLTIRVPEVMMKSLPSQVDVISKMLELSSLEPSAMSRKCIAALSTLYVKNLASIREKFGIHTHN